MLGRELGQQRGTFGGRQGGQHLLEGLLGLRSPDANLVIGRLHRAFTGGNAMLPPLVLQFHDKSLLRQRLHVFGRHVRPVNREVRGHGFSASLRASVNGRDGIVKSGHCILQLWIVGCVTQLVTYGIPQRVRGFYKQTELFLKRCFGSST